jgi:hypothetical protein
MGEDVSKMRLKADDSKNNKGTITMRCSFPVAAYPCNDPECNAWEPLPMYKDSEWPLRMEEAGVKCITHGFGACHCDDNECFECSSGKCDAYEKTLRTCINRANADPYSCFIHPNGAEALIDYPGWPWGFLVGAILCTLVCLLCTVGACGLMANKQLNCAQILATLIGVCCAVSVGVIISVVIGAITGDSRTGVQSGNFTDFAVANDAGEGGTTFLVPEEVPPPPGLPAWAIVLIVLGSIFGLACLMICCVLCCTAFAERGNRARTKAIYFHQAPAFIVGQQVRCKTKMDGESSLGRVKERRLRGLPLVDLEDWVNPQVPLLCTAVENEEEETVSGELKIQFGTIDDAVANLFAAVIQQAAPTLPASSIEAEAKKIDVVDFVTSFTISYKMAVPPKGMPSLVQNLMHLDLLDGKNGCEQLKRTWRAVAISSDLGEGITIDEIQVVKEPVVEQGLITNASNLSCTAPSKSTSKATLSSSYSKLRTFGAHAEDLELQSSYSRQDLRDLVQKGRSELSIAEVIGHQVLLHAESTKSFFRRDRNDLQDPKSTE